MENPAPITFIPNALGNALSEEFFETIWSSVGNGVSHHSLFKLPFLLNGANIVPAVPTKDVAILWAALNEMWLMNQECITLECFQSTVNYFRSDDDPVFDAERPIVLVNMGGAVTITLRNLDTKEEQAVTMSDGSVMIMEPGMQKTHSYSAHSATDNQRSVLITLRPMNRPS